MSGDFPCGCAINDDRAENRWDCSTLEECNHEYCVCECDDYDSQEEYKKSKDDFDYEKVVL